MNASDEEKFRVIDLHGKTVLESIEQTLEVCDSYEMAWEVIEDVEGYKGLIQMNLTITYEIDNEVLHIFLEFLTHDGDMFTLAHAGGQDINDVASLFFEE